MPATQTGVRASARSRGHEATPHNGRRPATLTGFARINSVWRSRTNMSVRRHALFIETNAVRCNGSAASHVTNRARRSSQARSESIQVTHCAAWR